MPPFTKRLYRKCFESYRGTKNDIDVGDYSSPLMKRGMQAWKTCSILCLPQYTASNFWYSQNSVSYTYLTSVFFIVF